MTSMLLACGGLFLTSFLAATLLPAQSELVLAGLLTQHAAPAWLLLTVATLGNTAGSSVNWLLGRAVTRFRDRRWFPVSPAALARAEHWYRRYGRWTLLLSWAPVIGDPLTLAAGEKLKVPERAMQPHLNCSLKTIWGWCVRPHSHSANAALNRMTSFR